MSIRERDYILKMIEQLAAALSRVAGLKTAGKLDEAGDEIRNTADAILGPLANTVDALDAASAAKLLGNRQKIGVYAALVAELADIRAREGRDAEARSKYRRALEVQLACLSEHPDGAEQTRTAIRALRSKVVEADLPEKLRRALDAALG
jgi:hypothetical protein